MSETTLQNDAATTAACGARYSRVQSSAAAAPLAPSTSSSHEPMQGSPSYAKAYRADNNRVVVTYSPAEAHARAVRKQISRLLPNND
jgi:hypothetical protein